MRVLAEQEPNPSLGASREALVSRTFRYLLDRPERARLGVLAADQKLVGCIVPTLAFCFEFFGADAFIGKLYIVPEYRRLGFGLRAVQFIEVGANKFGVNAVHLEVDESNDAAFELNRRMGFEHHNRFLVTKWLPNPQ
jgi:ribosomal protein S18 acetylase RimI-like enzyme